jgi:hypothetical protein
MKKHYIIGLLTILVLSVSTFAQNTLQVSDVRVQPDQTVMVPIQLTNSQPIVAVQFDISVPQGSWMSTPTPMLTERAAGHQAAINSFNDTTYTVMVWSTSNDAILGHYGELMGIELYSGSYVTEGNVYELKLSKVVLALRDGSNVMTGWTDGKMYIENTPDLIIHDVQADKT